MRSIVLDSVVGLDPRLSAEWDPISRILNDCQADAACNRAYPGIINTYNDLRANWENPVLDLGNGETQRISFDRFRGNLIQIAGGTLGAWQVPYLIEQAAHGDILAVASFSNSYTVFTAMNIAINCNDASRFDSENSPGCEALNIERGPALNRQPPNYRGAALIINGAYDWITPSTNAERVAAQLPQAYYFEFPYLAHGVARSPEACAKAIVFAFLDKPGQAPDPSCIDSTRPAFALPDENAPESGALKGLSDETALRLKNRLLQP